MGANDQVKTLAKYIPRGEESPQTFLDLVKTQIMGVDGKGMPRPIEELAYFLRVAHKAGLDPIAKQIHVVYRWDSKLGREKMAIQTGIDGLRLIAQRSTEYAGQDDVVYESEDVEYPKWAKVTVYRFNKNIGERIPYTATARWKEYCPTGKDGKPMIMWAKMPFLMLGKVAEALALRKAFPQELSGLYSEDEMAQQSGGGSRFTDLPKPASVKSREDVKSGGNETIVEDAKPAGSVTDAVIEDSPADDEIPVIHLGEDGEEIVEDVVGKFKAQ